MKCRLLFLCAVSMSWMSALHAGNGDVMATSNPTAFRVYTTTDATYAAMSAADVAALMPVTYRVGETVTAVSRNGESSTLVTAAATIGSVTFTPDAGGIWTLENSNGETARIGVAWEVYGDGGMLAAGTASSAYVVDSEYDGPDRKTYRNGAPLVAYSGDDWIGDAAKAVTLTFVSPDGAETALNLSGTGTTSFLFDKSGTWTVFLAMADGTIKESTILVEGGLVIVIK